MGSWGYGMCDNDTAWDAVCKVKKLIDKLPAELSKDEIKNIMNIFNRSEAVLGVCEWFIEAGVNPELLPYEKYVDLELDETILIHWQEPEVRRNALEDFRMIIGNNKISKSWKHFLKEEN